MFARDEEKKPMIKHKLILPTSVDVRKGGGD